MRVAGHNNRGFVLADMFRFYGTHGLPLEVILHWCVQKGHAIDWIDYVRDAIRDGHNPATIGARIRSAVSDVYGREYFAEFDKRLSIVMAAIP